MPEGIRLAPSKSAGTRRKDWLTAELKEWVDETVYDLRTGLIAHWIKGDALEQEWNRCKSGAPYDAGRVWKWINLHLMLQQLTATKNISV